jgi:hypothetical protein
VIEIIKKPTLLLAAKLVLVIDEECKHIHPKSHQNDPFPRHQVDSLHHQEKELQT